MEDYFVDGAQTLLMEAKDIINRYSLEWEKDEDAKLIIPEKFKKEFFLLIDKVNLNLLEEEDNFYGYFLFQMTREIRFDLGGPTGILFQGTGYIICYNPLMYLMLSKEQMETAVKHEILHILSLHPMRAKAYRGIYDDLAVNMAMDIVVNRLLDHLPPYATTLEWVNLKYSLSLKADESFESYLERIQEALTLAEDDDASESGYSDSDNKSQKEDNYEGEGAETYDEEAESSLSNLEHLKWKIETQYSVEKSHAIWREWDEPEDQILREFTKKAAENAIKGKLPACLTGLIEALQESGEELPWNLYLNRLMGAMESRKKKTVTRRNRRQPERAELRGELRDHKANLIVALDISGSITEEEFRQAMKEVFSIVRNYKHEITVVECDDEIRRIYKVKSEQDMKERPSDKGATRFSPVIEYANSSKVNLLIYFTDGKGEDRLRLVPRGYKILWVISGRGDRISLKNSYGIVKKLKNIKAKDTEPDMNELQRSGFSMMNQENG